MLVCTIPHLIDIFLAGVVFGAIAVICAMFSYAYFDGYFKRKNK